MAASRLGALHEYIHMPVPSRYGHMLPGRPSGLASRLEFTAAAAANRRHIRPRADGGGELSNTPVHAQAAAASRVMQSSTRGRRQRGAETFG